MRRRAERRGAVRCRALRRRICCERGLMPDSSTTSVSQIVTPELRLAYLLIEFANNNEIYSTIIKRQPAWQRPLKTAVTFHRLLALLFCFVCVRTYRPILFYRVGQQISAATDGPA